MPWLASGQVNDYIVRAAREHITPEAQKVSNLRMFPAGSVILGMVGQGRTRGMAAYLAIDATINQNLAGITPSARLNGRYLHYMLTAAYDFQRNYGRGGNQAALNCAIVGSFPALLPSRQEQDQIAAYLRAQDAHFARFIKVKRDLIGLLTQQRLRVIDDAVMNGLNRSGSRKPSGIAWLDDVPDHWSVVRLRTLTSSITSGSRGWSDHAADSGPVFLRVGNLSRGTLDLKLAKTIRLNLPEGTRTEASRTRVQEGDILLSITAYIGSVGLVPKDMEEAYVSQHVARCRLRPNCANPKWVAYVLLSRVGQAHGTVCMYGGTKQGLSLSDVKNHVVLLPPPLEQDELVEHIERETAVIDSLIAAAKLELERVREYRERLISDGVTGQIDLRAWQPCPEDQITEEDLTALGDDDDNDTTEEETDGDDGHD